ISRSYVISTFPYTPHVPTPTEPYAHGANSIHRRGGSPAQGRDRAVGQQERGAADHRRGTLDRASGDARQRAAHPRHRDAGRAGEIGRAHVLTSVTLETRIP